jgi:metacaspase-1
MRKVRYVSVGINDYPGTGSDLAGCVNDSNDMVAEFVYWGATGFQLTDAMATRSAVSEALIEAVSSLGYLDTLLVHYSGHGTFVADLDADEADGRDEAWVCSDFAVGGVLTDDDLHEIFSRRRTGSRVVMLSDSCHSGTLARFAAAPMAATAAGIAAKFLPPTVALADADLAAKAEAVAGLPARGRSRATTAMISGCRDVEFSYDAWFDSGGVQRANGAFTRALLGTLHTPSVPNNLEQWYTRVAAQLPSQRFPQSPQLTATRAQRHWRPWPYAYGRSKEN